MFSVRMSPLPLAFDATYDLINDIVQRYVDAINHGFGLLKPDVAWVLNVLIIISVAWSALLWALSDDHVIVEFTRKLVYLGLFVWLVENWPALTGKLAQSFMNLGLKAGGFDGASTYTSQPGNIVYLGYTTAAPLMDQITRLCGPVDFFRHFMQIAFLFVAVVAIMVAFCVITIQVVVALLSFKFGSLAAFVLVPFGVLAKTSFIAERPLGWVVGSGLRLMVLTLVLGVANNIFQNLQAAPGSSITIYEALVIAVSALILMVLSLVASRLATDLVIGGPSLGVGMAVNQMAVAHNMTTGAVGYTAKSAIRAAKAAATIPISGPALSVTAGTIATTQAASALAGAGTSAANAAVSTLSSNVS
jgi:type IV secretion system protein TrbL